MSEKFRLNNKDNFRGNQDSFLFDLISSPEFIGMKEKYLPSEKYFIGVEQLIGRSVDINSESSLRIDACVSEVCQKFKIKGNIALKLVLNSPSTLIVSMNYTPFIYSDNNYVYIRLGSKTTQANVIGAWSRIRAEQRKLGNVSNKTSINSELAFCIYRQYILKNRKMMDIFRDYELGNLEGYNHQPTISDEHTFRKYYKNIVRGLLIR